MGFLVICFGITILQMSKIDPAELGNKLDRRSTMLFQAARQQTETLDEKNPLGAEEPGIDALRGSFGTFGSIIRARSARRMSQSSYASGNAPSRLGSSSGFKPGLPAHPRDNLAGMQRHQLFDNPVPRFDRRESDNISMQSQPTSARKQTIKFDNEDIVHQYHRGAGPDGSAIHEHRPAAGASPLSQIPSLPSLPSLQDSVGTVSVSTNDSSRTTAGGGPSLDSGSAYSGLPAASYTDAEHYGLRSAPVMGSSPPEQYTDPFAASPSTATIGSFDAEAQRIRGHSGRHTRESSRHSGRSNRSYPRGADRQEDAEESMRLFDQEMSDSEEGNHESEGLPPPGSVRLVQNRPPKDTFF